MASMITASASVPFGLGSSMVVSPYATLQLPNPPPIGITATSDNKSNDAMQLALTFDQYNLIRSQLDHVHQSAQVANCQVQFLRDQLSNETTARLEAQSRNNQLLNFQRDLLDQMNHLVLRLQKLETVYANTPEKNNQVKFFTVLSFLLILYFSKYKKKYYFIFIEYSIRKNNP